MKDQVKLNLNCKSVEETIMIISETNLSVSVAAVLCHGCMLESLQEV